MWVSWVRRNLIGHRSFWELEHIVSGSWIWKSICKLRALARPFIVCSIGSGISCNFWSENWTGLGHLLEITGDSGPAVTGLSKDSVVADAIVDGDWWIARSRSRNPIIHLLKDCLPPSTIVNSEDGAVDDCFLWKIGDGQPSHTFSASRTWDHLNPAGPPVDWCKTVWFKGRIPKHAFLSWVSSRNMLHTRDRLLSWGISVPSTCLLCNTHDETRQHLFFDCSYAGAVWSSFTSRARVVPPILFEDCLRWLKNPSCDKNVALILKLAFQASLYLLWRERNSRLHNSSSRPYSALIQEINTLIRCRLDPLSREHRSNPQFVSPLVTWFGVFHS